VVELTVGQALACIAPGEPIITICHPKWWPPWKPLPCLGIKGWQLVQGYKPWHVYTHVGRYLGDGKLFEVTTPKARIIDVREFLDGADFRLAQRIVHGKPFRFSDDALRYMWEAAEKLNGTSYDVGQLFNHVVMDLYGVPLDGWTRITDLSANQRVCSAGDSYVEEYARRAIAGLLRKSIRLQPTATLVGSGLLASVEQWPRAFALPYDGPVDGTYIHTERVKPADYGKHDDYRIYARSVS